MPMPKAATASHGPRRAERGLGRGELQRRDADEQGGPDDAQGQQQQLGRPGRQPARSRDHLTAGQLDHGGGEQGAGQQGDQRGDQGGHDVGAPAEPGEQEDGERDAGGRGDGDQGLIAKRHPQTEQLQGPGEHAQRPRDQHAAAGAAQQDGESHGGEHAAEQLDQRREGRRRGPDRPDLPDGRARVQSQAGAVDDVVERLDLVQPQLDGCRSPPRWSAVRHPLGAETTSAVGMAMTWTSGIPCADAMAYRSDWTSLTSKPASISASPAMDISRSTSSSVAGSERDPSRPGRGGDPATRGQLAQQQPDQDQDDEGDDRRGQRDGGAQCWPAGSTGSSPPASPSRTPGSGEAVGDGVGRERRRRRRSSGVGLALTRSGSGRLGGRVDRSAGRSGCPAWSDRGSAGSGDGCRDAAS